MQEQESKRSLITGGRGFIGGQLGSRLEQMGHDVDYFDLLDGKDVTDRELVLKEIGKQRYDVIFHLAGRLGTEELNDQAHEATRVNVLGAVNIFDAAKKNGARVVLVSKPNPWLNTYSITKGAAEQFARMYTKIHNVDIRVGQFYSIYGPGQDIHGVQKAVPTFIARALQNDPIPVFGDGEQTADFIYTSDASEAMAVLGHLEGLAGEVVEIGSGTPTKINFLAETIIRLSDSRSKIEYLPMRKGEPEGSQISANTSKMITLLQFNPSVALEDGLRETIAWWKNIKLGKSTFVSAP